MRRQHPLTAVLAAVASRYGWASLMVTSNKPFGRCGRRQGASPANSSVRSLPAAVSRRTCT